jgi:hypothetical protein
MKQRPPKRPKQFRRPTKRLPPTSTLPSEWLTPLAEPTPIRGTPNPALGTSGIVQPPLPLRDPADQAAFTGKVEQHREMLSRTEVLDWLIANLPERPKGGPGHNLQPITKDDVQEIKQAIAALKALPVTPKASDKNKASAAGSILKKIGERLGIYLDDCLSEASKSAGKELGKRLVKLSYWLALSSALTSAVQSVINWLH